MSEVFYVFLCRVPLGCYARTVDAHHLLGGRDPLWSVHARELAVSWAWGAARAASGKCPAADCGVSPCALGSTSPLLQVYSTTGVNWQSPD